jgi:hypothetical protein
MMATKVEVKKAGGTGTDIHVVEGDPPKNSSLVNSAVKSKKRLVIFEIPGDKKLSVIAENVVAIWEE